MSVLGADYARDGLVICRDLYRPEQRRDNGSTP